jgi:hypothetical protein
MAKVHRPGLFGLLFIFATGQFPLVNSWIGREHSQGWWGIAAAIGEWRKEHGGRGCC